MSTIDLLRPLKVGEFAYELNQTERTVRRWIQNARSGKRSPLLPTEIIKLNGAGVLIKADAVRRLLGEADAPTPDSIHRAAMQSLQNEAAKRALFKRFGKVK